MNILPLNFIKKNFIYLEEPNTITQKVCRVSKKILDYFVYHKQGIAIAIWSYFIIEVGVIAADRNWTDSPLEEVDSCRQILCHYWDSRANFLQASGMSSDPLQDKCETVPKEIRSYSFMQCVKDLCNYATSLGETFYACPLEDTQVDNIESEKPNPIVKLWEKACPTRHLKHLHHLKHLKQLKYISRCIKKMCAARDDFFLGTEVAELCNTKSIDELYKLLSNINRSLKKLKKSFNSEDMVATTNSIAGLIGALSGIVSGAAGIATLYLTYRATKVASTVITKAIPSLQQGIEGIAKSTVDSAMVALREATPQPPELISMRSLNTMRELTEALEKQSLYYSFDKTALSNESPSNSGSSRASGTGTSGAGIGINAGGALVKGGSAAALVLGIVSVAKHDGVVINRAGKINNPITEVIKKVSTATTPLSEEYNSFSTTIDPNCFYNKSYVTINPYHITLQSIDCMRNYLPIWNNSFCFYEKSTEFFACRLPSFRHEFERAISFFLREIEGFFSANDSALCYFSREDLWCHWNRFLDSIFSKRNIGFFNDEDCPWDQFSLKIYETDKNMYTLQATGQCYNETEWIKI